MRLTLPVKGSVSCDLAERPQASIERHTNPDLSLRRMSNSSTRPNGTRFCCRALFETQPQLPELDRADSSKGLLGAARIQDSNDYGQFPATVQLIAMAVGAVSHQRAR